MAQVITFENYRPSPRYDDLAWTEVQIEEGPDQDGPWTVIDTITLSPVDADPSEPQVRNVTTELASDTEGLWYRLVFYDATGDESQATSPVQNTAISTLSLYVTPSELKRTLELEGTSYADDDILLACESASRAIDGYTDSRFYPTTETRYYTATWFGPRYSDGFTNEANGQLDGWLAIDDAVSVTSVTIDTDGNGSYETTWVEGTDFYLDPPNAALQGQPSRRLVLRSQAGRTFPSYARGVKVTGSFGWAESPAQVRQAARILAGRFLKRTRETPYGIQVVAGDAVAMARLGRIDPDVAFLLDTLPGKKTVLFV